MPCIDTSRFLSFCMQNGQNSCMYRLSAPKDLLARDLLSSLLVLVHHFPLFLSCYFLAMVDLDLCTKLKISTMVITSGRNTFILLIVLTEHPVPCKVCCVSSFTVTGVQRTDKFFTRCHAKFCCWDVIAQCCYRLRHLGTNA